MLKIGLTGGIGSGKSEVSRLFAEHGTLIIDTDQISHQLVSPGSSALNAIIDFFGEEFLLADGNLDRQKMRERVFNNEKSRSALEAILHPLIMREVNQQASKAKGDYVIIVIPLLLETKQQDLVDRVLLVDSPVAKQRERVMARDGINEELFEKILASQASRQARQEFADDIILNDADITALKQQVATLHRKYILLNQQQ